DGSEKECNLPFTLIGPHRCEKTAVPNKKHRRDESIGNPISNKRERKDDKRAQKEQKERDKRPRRDMALIPSSSPVASAETTSHQTNSAANGNASSLQGQPPQPQTNGPSSTTTNDVAVSDDMTVNGGDEPATLHGHVHIIQPEEVIVLQGHDTEVYSCSWNPTVPNLIASGSGDATARLWQVPQTGMQVPPPIVLNHLPNLNDNKDVTTLDWDPSGMLLATGSYDGQARIWTPRGELRWVMTQHRGPIFSLKWNKRGDLVLSGSADNTTVVWDPETGDMKQQFELHEKAILDVDWMDNTIFASCSTDKTIYGWVNDANKDMARPRGRLAGNHDGVKQYHYWLRDEVNAVRWDPTGEYLASCSDDKTAKIWSPSQDTWVQEIRGHEMEIYSLQWAPRSSLSSPDIPRILATASFDATVRLWDALSATCLHLLRNHSGPVYSISFSPDAKYLATGSFDEVLNVWNAEEGTLLKTYRGNGGIFEVHFNKTGDKLAACTSNRQVVILDMREESS
ncbi:LOW QUALITY PROTEIN: quinon protein alcohol dehydrogenase-like superfamily, partial [Jimgerdemannia flammicorona]